MNRRAFIAGLGSAAVWPVVARAQQPSVPVVGFFSSRSPDDSAHLITAFLRGLAEQGFIEGKNVSVEYEWARGQWERLPSIAADLVQRKVDVIVAAGGDPASLAAKAATNTIPIVFLTARDPVKLGIVASFNRPGGNATGGMVMTSYLEQKRLGILHELVPAATLIFALVNPKFPQAEDTLREIQKAADNIGQHVKILLASNEAELDAVLAFTKMPDRALLVTADPFFDTQRSKILLAAAQAQLPAIYQFRDYAFAGGLMSYGPSITENYRQLGIYVGRILKGEKPGDLPIVGSTKFEFVINLKTARELGLTVSPNLLSMADEVIE